MATALLAVGGAPAGSAAGEASGELPRWREVWAGADISSDVWLVYSGVTVAPFSHIHGEGLRLRAAGGFGEYRYTDNRTGKLNSFQAQTRFADFLVGYLVRYGELTAKAFAGFSSISHDVDPFDDETLVTGEHAGVKGVVELWLNMGPHAWSSLDVAWASAHNTRSARLRSGYRLWPSVSVGVEGAVNVDAQGECRMEDASHGACKIRYDASDGVATLLDYGRGGLFVRYEWAGGEVSLGGGVLGGSFRGEAASDLDPYVTVNWVAQF